MIPIRWAELDENELRHNDYVTGVKQGWSSRTYYVLQYRLPDLEGKEVWADVPVRGET